MDAEDAIKERRSIRKYKDAPLDWDKVTRILEAGRYAPSAGNLQTVKFLVILDEAQRKRIAEISHNQNWMAEAPVHIIVCAEEGRTAKFYSDRGERLYSVQNAAAAIENMLICASALNVGSCWVGAFDEDELKDEFGIPGDVRPQAIITLGYADEVTPRPQKYDLQIFCFLDRYGNRIGDMDKLLGDYSLITERNIKEVKEYLEKKVPKAVETAKEFGKEAKKAVREKIKKKLLGIRKEGDLP